MKKDNKDIIDKSKKILTEFGYDIKTSHLYELYSKLNDEASWNVAKAKNIQFSNVLNQEEVIKQYQNEQESNFYTSSLKEYLSDLKSRYFNDVFNLGLIDQPQDIKHSVLKNIFTFKNKLKKWFFRDFADTPNAIFFGKMGSGKSMACRFTLLTWMLANSYKTQLFIVSPSKNSKFEIFYKKDKLGNNKYGQVMEVPIENLTKIQSLIELVWKEYKSRNELYNKENVYSLKSYERNTKDTSNRIVILIESFEQLLRIINFEEEWKKEGTTSRKLFTLLMAGRSCGIWFLACSEREDRPESPRVPYQYFNIVRHVENGFLNEGMVGKSQYPEITDDMVSDLLDINMKTQTGNFAYLIEDIINKSLNK